MQGFWLLCTFLSACPENRMDIDTWLVIEWLSDRFGEEMYKKAILI